MAGRGAAGPAPRPWSSGGDERITGAPQGGALSDRDNDIVVLARSIFTDYVFAFEVTSVLLVIAVVGAVVAGPPPGGATATARRSGAPEWR